MTAINWKNGVDGDWSLNTNWNPATVPGGGDAVTIAAASAVPYAVTISVAEAASTLTLNQKNATVADQATLTMGGALTLTAGAFDLKATGTIKGGALVMNGGTLLTDGGTLDGVKVQGVLNLTQSFGGALTIRDGLTLTDKAGTGGGLINLTGLGMQLNFGPGVQTLNSAVAGKASTINIGSSSGDTIFGGSAVGTVSTANIGSLVSIIQTGRSAALVASGQAGDSMVNQGTILAILSGGGFTINGGAFVNKGLINVNNGDVLTIDSSNFSNSGTVNIVNGSTLNIGQDGSWSSTGKINVTDATINLLATVTQAELNSITRAGGLVDLAGTMNLAGGTLNVGAGTAIGGLLLTGTIKNGTVHDGGLGLQFGTGFFPAPTLDGVIYQGAVDLSESGARLTVLDAFTVTGTGGTGPGTINLTGNNSNLTLTGSRTLDNATVRIGNASLAIANPGTTTAVTFGPNLTIKQGGVGGSFSGVNSSISGSFSPSDSLLNQGSIFGSIQNAALTINGFGTFTNAGSIAFSNGDNLTISAGTVTNQSSITLGNGVVASFTGTSSFNNKAVVSAGSGDSISISAGTITNPGTMLIGSGSTLGISGFTSFANTGSLNLAAGATLNIGSSSAAWTSTGKITATNATVNLDGVVTQGQIAAITRVGGVIDIAGTLNNTGTTLNVGTGSAFGALVLTGEIDGGIIHDTGNGLTFGNGASFGNAPVLDGVAYRGVVDLSEINAHLDVLDSIVLTGTAGTGAGTVNLTGIGSELTVGSSSSSGSQVLNNATINIGAATSSIFFGSGATLAAASNFFGGDPTLLTLGPSLRLQHVGQFATLAGPNNDGDMLINRGTIAAGLSGGGFTVTGNQFNNLGLVSIANGDSFSIQSSSFTNAGTVNVITGGTLAVGSGGDWISTGTIKETNATVVLNGDVTLPEINSITRSGGTIVIAGRFDNQSSTLKVGTGSKLGNFVLSGTIDNGIVNDAGGGLVMHGGTLDTVTYQGLIDLSTAGAALTVLGGLTATDVTGTKAGTIKLTGAGSILTLQEPQTLDNATISIGSVGGDTIAVSSPFFQGGPWTTTLGSKLLIQQTGLAAALSGVTDTTDILANAGTIAAGFSGGTFFITSDIFANSGSITVSNKDTLDLDAGNFSNTGTVNVITGGILNLGTSSFFGPPNTWTSTGKLSETNGTINLDGAVTLANLNSITRSGGTITLLGTADLGGGTLNVGTGSALGALVVNGGTIQNGTVHDADPGLIFSSDSDFGESGTLKNVNYDGTLDLSESNANVLLAGAVTFAGLNGTGLGTILLTGPGSSLTTQGTFLLDNAKLSLGGATLDAESNFGTFPSTAGLLTLGKNLSITHTLSSGGTTGFSLITSQNGSLGQPGSIISQGSIAAGLKGGSLDIAGGSFTNQGSMSVSNGDSVLVTASSFSNSGMVSVNGGILTIGDAGALSPTFGNTGSVTVTGGGTLNLGPSFAAEQFTWTSSGVLSETGGSINLNGPVTLANLNSITRSGGTVTLAGTFDNGNSATALNVGTGSKLGTLALTGSIANATVNDAGAGVAFQGFQSTLDHVTYQGTMDLSAANSTVTVLNGLTLKGLNGSGAAKVLLTGSGSTMTLEGTQTLDNALLDIGGGASLLAIATTGSVAAAPPQLTLGSKLNVVHTGGNATIGTNFFGASSSTIINQGSISAKVAGGALTIGGNNGGAGLIFNNKGIVTVGAADTLSIAAATFTNSGSVNATTGGVLNVGQLFGASTWSSTGAITETGATINLFGTTTIGSMNKITRSGGTVNFQGTLNGAGGTLNVGTGTALGLLQDTGTINSTIVHDAGNGMRFFGPPHSGGGGAVFNGVTYRGVLDLSPSQSNLTVAGGFTLTNLAGTGAGVANLTGAASVLFAAGTETFDNFTLNMGNGEALGSTLFQTDPSATGAKLTLGSKLTINQVGAFANVVGARNLGDQIVNGGKIMANYAGGQFLITEGSFVNNGSIIVGNMDTLTLDPDQLTNTGSLIINQAGTLRVDGALAGGTVNFTDKSSGTLMLGTPGSVTTQMVGFGATDATHSDAIDLLNTVATKATYSGTASSGVLTVTNAAAATVATLNFTGSYTTASFSLVSDGNGGTLILDPPVNANTVGAPAMQFVAGSSVVDASAGNETLTLPGAGSSPETITGFGLSNGDMLDLHKVLAGSGWNGDPSTIASFVGVSADGSNTTISVDPSGHGGGSVVATLAGINTSLDELAAHGAIRFGWGGG